MSSKVSLEDVKKLREATGVGMQDAQKALLEAEGDLSKAQELLRRKGLAVAAKKSARATKSGLVHAYVHGGKVGVLLEVSCETDFVAKTDDFKNLTHDLALQIAAMAPRYIARQDVPADAVAAERSIFMDQAKAQNKPAEVTERIVEGKLDKFFGEICLLEQPTIKDPKVIVSRLLTDAIQKLGENIVIARFARFQLGESGKN